MNEREIRIHMGVVKRQTEQQRAGITDEQLRVDEKILRLRTIVDDRAESLVMEVTKRIEAETRSLHTTINALEQKLKEKSTKQSNMLDAQCSRIDELDMKLTRLLEQLEREKAKLVEENIKLKSTSGLTKSGASPAASAESSVDPRASTLAIFDSIVFAISNWSNEGDAAPDFELACQSILFPVIYERVMKGEDDYYMEEVPSTAYEVVAMGREFVKHLRNICNASLVDEKAWETHAPSVQRWWVNDALPHLYGARADEWAEDKPFSLLEVQEWKAQPAARALHFPLIFDGYELVEKHRDQIRETTGLPEFNKQTLQTRLQP